MDKLPLMKAWESYESQVMPRDAGRSQRTETRRAFYAGAQALLQVVLATGEDSVTEDQGVIVLEVLRRECEAFVDLIRKGKA
jgi:hypothetical protein